MPSIGVYFPDETYKKLFKFMDESEYPWKFNELIRHMIEGSIGYLNNSYFRLTELNQQRFIFKMREKYWNVFQTLNYFVASDNSRDNTIDDLMKENSHLKEMISKAKETMAQNQIVNLDLEKT